MIEFKEMYQVFKTSDGRVWKIEVTLIPKEDVEHWQKSGVFITKDDLLAIGISIP
jgi:hypothetical protein